MSKLLVPAIILTIIVGIAWFVIFPGKESVVVSWLSSKKNTIEQTIKDRQLVKTTSTSLFETKEYTVLVPEKSKKYHIVLNKINLEKASISLILNNQDRLFAISDLAKDNECAVAINGMFYDTNFAPLGLIVENGVKVHSLHSQTLLNGIFYVDSQKNPGIVAVDDYVVEGDILAFQSGPILILDGQKQELTIRNDEEDPRSFILIDTNKSMWLGVVYPSLDQGLSGLTLEELAQVLSNSQTHFGFAISAALNLDGGSSTGMYTDKLYLKEKNLPQNILCVK